VSSEYVLSREGRKEGTSRYDCLEGGCTKPLEAVKAPFQLDGEATTVLPLEEGVLGPEPSWIEMLLIDMIQYAPSLNRRRKKGRTMSGARTSSCSAKEKICGTTKYNADTDDNGDVMLPEEWAMGGAYSACTCIRDKTTEEGKESSKKRSSESRMRRHRAVRSKKASYAVPRYAQPLLKRPVTTNRRHPRVSAGRA
jgi:hypothetical protein